MNLTSDEEIIQPMPFNMEFFSAGISSKTIDMQASQILTADLIDILFENKNKSYGAYQLRRQYPKRLITALFLTCILIVPFIAAIPSGKDTDKGGVNTSNDSLTLIELSSHEIPLEPLPPLPPPPPSAPVTSIVFTTPLITSENVRSSEMPPAVDEMNNLRIDNIYTDGKDGEYTAPPIADGSNGVISNPVRESDKEDSVFIDVQIESSYPGGPAAWKRFLVKTFRYPADAEEKKIQGRVTVSFIVDKNGKVSEVRPISGPDELKAEAVRVINKSGNWTPAVNNGRKVNSFKRQEIIFMLQDE